MAYSNKFLYYPGGENEAGNTSPGDDAAQPDSSAKAPEIKEEHKEHKTVMEKIKEALHDWSNKDERDQEFDDTRV